MTTTAERPPFTIAEHETPSGKRTQFELPISRLVSGTPIGLPVIIVHGINDGPTVWLNAAIHGDELCGVEIIRRVLDDLDPTTLRGTLIAAPIVNVHGFNTGDRYLPDRRDLNRSFPGSRRGALAGRIAHLLMTEIVERCSLGIDLHTGSDHRTNLPQIRADLNDPTTLKMAKVFGAPVTIHSQTRDGSLRQAATDAGATVLLYEAGEAMRFDRDALSVGSAGVRRVLHELGMIARPDDEPAPTTQLSWDTKWVRTSRSGILDIHPTLGDRVSKGETIAIVRDPFGKQRATITSTLDGVIIGQTQHPLVNRGDAVFHIAATTN